MPEDAPVIHTTLPAKSFMPANLDQGTGVYT
jgi:hypothetical protein